MSGEEGVPEQLEKRTLCQIKWRFCKVKNYRLRDCKSVEGDKNRLKSSDAQRVENSVENVDNYVYHKL